MNQVYYVVIKGRTLESRNLRELLARAVSAKRDLDRRFSLQAQYGKQRIPDRGSNEKMAAASGAMG